MKKLTKALVILVTLMTMLTSASAQRVISWGQTFFFSYTGYYPTNSLSLIIDSASNSCLYDTTNGALTKYSSTTHTPVYTTHATFGKNAMAGADKRGNFFTAGLRTANNAGIGEYDTVQLHKSTASAYFIDNNIRKNCPYKRYLDFSVIGNNIGSVVEFDSTTYGSNYYYFNIFTSNGINSVTKRCQKKINYTGTRSKTYGNLFILKGGYVYVMIENNICKIDTANGNVLSTYPGVEVLTDFCSTGNYIYLAYRNSYVNKIEKLDYNLNVLKSVADSNKNDSPVISITTNGKYILSAMSRWCMINSGRVRRSVVEQQDTSDLSVLSTDTLLTDIRQIKYTGISEDFMITGINANYSNPIDSLKFHNYPAGYADLFIALYSMGCHSTIATAISVVTPVSCHSSNDGSLTATGSPSYIYSWSGPNSYVGSTNTISNLIAGTYNVTVTNQYGCSAISSATLTEPAIITATYTKMDATCFGDYDGNISLGVSGGTAPYTYSWSNNKTVSAISGLNVGTYNVTITDNHSCDKTISISITQPQQLVITVDSSNKSLLVATATGGTTPYYYLWDNTQSGSTFSTTPGNHILKVTDKNGCMATVSFHTGSTGTTGIATVGDLSITGSMYPNPTSGKVTIIMERAVQGRFMIYNLLGESVKSITVTEETTTFDIADLSVGIYGVKLEAVSGNKVMGRICKTN